MPDPLTVDKVLLFTDYSGLSSYCLCDSNGDAWQHAVHPAGWSDFDEMQRVAAAQHPGAEQQLAVGVDPWWPDVA